MSGTPHPVENPLNPAAVAPDALARMLGVAPATIQRHIGQGAPVNGDGTVNLLHYAAWLNVEETQRHRDGETK